jgi:DNA-binding SARP family transcriptional activator
LNSAWRNGVSTTPLPDSDAQVARGMDTATATDAALGGGRRRGGCVQKFRYGMLGPLVVQWDGRQDEIMGRRPQTVLVCLLLARGRSVSDQRLIDALYGSQPTSSARNQIQQAVSALRQLGVPIARVDGGYVLPVADDEVDAFLFEQRLDSASAAAEAGRYEEAAALLREGLDLWRGQPLAGLDGPLTAITRANLEELRIAALVEHGNAELELGRHTRLIGELRDLVAEHPLHERFHAQLMLALYRDGRQAEALEVFATLQGVLIEELGTDPSPAVRKLHRQVLAQDPKLDGPGPAPALPRQLPPPRRQPLLGRDAERQRIRKALDGDGPRVVAITGFGGMGKTALAVQTAHELADRFPDGQLFMNLTGPADPSDVLGVFLRALGLREAEVPDRLAQRAACFRSLVAGRRLLILLDDACSLDQVLPLLPGADGCAVIITSRSWEISALDWGLVQLGPLTEADARLLLAHGAGQMLLDAEPQATQEILKQCAGLPLALEIVSLRLRSRPALMSRMAGRLADRDRMLTELSVGDRAVRTVLEIGYQTLDAPLQALLRRIACYGAREVTPELVAALADLPLARAEYLLEDLVDADFLHAGTDQNAYQCHDMVLAYCHQQALAEDSAEDRAAALERAFG